jgi:hypothetical protein
MHWPVLNGMQPVGMTQERQVMNVRIGHSDHEQSDDSQRADPCLFMRQVIDNSSQTTDGQDKKESELVSQMMKEFQLCGTQIEESQQGKGDRDNGKNGTIQDAKQGRKVGNFAQLGKGKETFGNRRHLFDVINVFGRRGQKEGRLGKEGGPGRIFRDGHRRLGACQSRGMTEGYRWRWCQQQQHEKNSSKGTATQQGHHGQRFGQATTVG